MNELIFYNSKIESGEFWILDMFVGNTKRPIELKKYWQKKKAYSKQTLLLLPVFLVHAWVYACSKQEKAYSSDFQVASGIKHVNVAKAIEISQFF